MSNTLSLYLDLFQDAYLIGKSNSMAQIEKLHVDTDFFALMNEGGTVSYICKINKTSVDLVGHSEPWRGLRIRGTLDFCLSGVLVSVLNPLANSGVSVLVSSTFDTDIIFVKEKQLSEALNALTDAGHNISSSTGDRKWSL